MTYRVDLTRKAKKQLFDLPPAMRRRVDAVILRMADDPGRSARKLVARPGFRVRVGDYRLLFDVDDEFNIVTVGQILHRREAYR